MSEAHANGQRACAEGGNHGRGVELPQTAVSTTNQLRKSSLMPGRPIARHTSLLASDWLPSICIAIHMICVP
jgi:hypothetical protein